MPAERRRKNEPSPRKMLPAMAMITSRSMLFFLLLPRYLLMSVHKKECDYGQSGYDHGLCAVGVVLREDRRLVDEVFHIILFG